MQPAAATAIVCLTEGFAGTGTIATFIAGLADHDIGRAAILDAACIQGLGECTLGFFPFLQVSIGPAKTLEHRTAATGRCSLLDHRNGFLVLTGNLIQVGQQFEVLQRLADAPGIHFLLEEAHVRD